MKGLLILGIVLGIVALTISALTSASTPGEHDAEETGVTGPLRPGAVSVSKMSVDVWGTPRDSFSRTDRAQLHQGTLMPGDRFRVTKNVWRRGNLWIKIEGLDGVDLVGWVHSPAAEPFRAKLAKKPKP